MTEDRNNLVKRFFCFIKRSICLPKGKLHWISAILLLIAFVSYSGLWLSNNMIIFNDTGWQNDDARIHVMPMHRFDGSETLKNDPVANDMLAFSTLGFRMIFMVFTRFTSVFVTAKIVVALSYLILLTAVMITALSRKAGLACASLLGFFFLHTDKINKASTTGIQRGFAFPIISLWMAGAVSQKPFVRYAAIILGAITYPSIMAIILIAEGLLILQGGINLRSSAFWKPIRACVIVLVICVTLIQVDKWTKPYGGKLPTLKEARLNAAFGKDGRTTKIPLIAPESELAKNVAAVFDTGRGNKHLDAHKIFKRLKTATAAPFLIIILLMSAFKISPKPKAATALMCSGIFLYMIARIFAFRLLYIPHRYLAYGTVTAIIMLFVSSLGLIRLKSNKAQLQASIRNFAAVIAIFAVIFATGDHIRADAALTIDRRTLAPIWNYIAELPSDVLITAHPADADGISFWTGKPATPGTEHLLPWLDESWIRNKEKAEKTLAILYSTDKSKLLSECQALNITHILVDKERYKADFKKQSKTFEPISEFTLNLLKGVEPENLVLSQTPDQAIIFQLGSFILVDVTLLNNAWNN